MAKKELSTITEDTIKAQWQKQTAAHQKQWNAVVRIAAALGIVIDEDGNITETAERPNLLSADKGGNAPDIDLDALREVVKDTAMDGALAIMHNVQIDNSLLEKPHREVFENETKSWNRWFVQNLKGVVERTIQHTQTLAQTPQPTPQPQHQSTAKCSKIPAWLARFGKRLWEDLNSTFWKSAAYIFGIFAITLAAVAYYQCKRYEPIVKEYAIMRLMLEADLDNRFYIQRLDPLLYENDVNMIYDRLQERKPQAKEELRQVETSE